MERNEQKWRRRAARLTAATSAPAGTTWRPSAEEADSKSTSRADKALFTLNITWLKDNEPIQGQHSHSLRVWDAILNWEDVQVTGTAPKEANGARFEISMRQYLGKRDYLDL
ncbi:MAG TPA: hypothetical protein DCG16_09010, partial [Gemmatimonadetes bacterium]|nr:hypothetical protein [Gemmatimonadota bacterium]